MREYKDWIVRYYASHEDIPKGHSDGEILRELVHCEDCRFYEPENKQCKMVIGTWFPEEYCNSSERKEEMGDTCTDGRFEMIEKAKRELIEATDITQSPKEMEALDDILFRLYQMGWLQKIGAADVQADIIPVAFIEDRMNDYAEDKFYAASMILDRLIAAWKREREEWPN